MQTTDANLFAILCRQLPLFPKGRNLYQEKTNDELRVNAGLKGGFDDFCALYKMVATFLYSGLTYLYIPQVDLLVTSL